MRLHVFVILAATVIGGCSSSGEVYQVPEGAEVAVIAVKDNIDPASTMEAKGGRNPVDWIFKVVDILNTVFPDQRAAISGIDGLATPGYMKKMEVHAGKRTIHLAALISGDVYDGTLQYNLKAGHRYRITIEVHDSARLATAGQRGRFEARLNDLSQGDEVLKKAYF